MVRENSNLPEIIEDRRQSEGHNFKMAQRVVKRISDVSSRMNALQNGSKLGAITPRGFDAT